MPSEEHLSQAAILGSDMRFEELGGSLSPDHIQWVTPEVAWLEIEPGDILLVQRVWPLTIRGQYAFFVVDRKHKRLEPRLRLVLHRDAESFQDASHHDLEQTRTAFRVLNQQMP